MSSVVLIVESDAALAAALRMVLASNGYRVLDAPNGAAAIRLLKTAELPDLILTGLDLPFVSGRELLDICRRDSRLRHIPTIALDEPYGAQPAALATARLARPFGSRQLIQLVQATLTAATSSTGRGGGT